MHSTDGVVDYVGVLIAGILLIVAAFLTNWDWPGWLALCAGSCVTALSAWPLTVIAVRAVRGRRNRDERPAVATMRTVTLPEDDEDEDETESGDAE